MAKSKNKRKKKKPASPNQMKPLSPENYIRKISRKLDVLECKINDDWQESGLAVIALVRQKKSGRLVLTSFVVDLKCLGVKNTAYWVDVYNDFYEDWLSKMSEGMDLNMVKIEPNLAYNIIYGAVDYAAAAGFEPQEDYKITKYNLAEQDTLIPESVTFGGEDGKPLFIAGPYDNSQKIMATLQRNLGEGNFHFIAAPF